MSPFRFLLLSMMVCAALASAPAFAQSFLDGQLGNGETQTQNVTVNTGSIAETAQDALGGSSFINQYDRKYKRVTEDDLQNIQSKNLLGAADKFTVQFIRREDDAYGMVNLRLEAPMTIQGCGSAYIPSVDVKQTGRAMEINIARPELIPGADMRYPHYECKITNGTPRVDVPISRNDLIAKRINRLKLKSGTAFDTYDVVLGDNNIMLTPLTSNSFRPADRENALTHVFYPVNMVILRVPGGVQDKELPLKMDLLAKRHKLIPVDAPIPNAKQYQFYALDKDYNVMLPLKKEGITKLDTISIDDIFYGANGPYAVSRKADVFVTLPGEFD